MREIVIRIVEDEDAGGAPGRRATFGHQGGTIGRAEGCTLVLPDAERTISRQHAQIVWRANGFFVAARGANPLHLNDGELCQGDEAPLHVGDELRIGTYRMRAESVAGAAYQAAGAALSPMGHDPLAFVASPAMPDGAAGASPAPAGAAPPRPILPADFDPFAAPAPIQAASPARGLGGLAAPSGMVDELVPHLDRASAVAGPVAMPFSPVIGRTAPVLDDLFGLGAGAPTPAGPLFAPAAPGAGDPLVAMGMIAATPQAARPEPDHASDLHAPFQPPRVVAAPVEQVHYSWPVDEVAGEFAAPGKPAPAPMALRRMPATTSVRVSEVPAPDLPAAALAGVARADATGLPSRPGRATQAVAPAPDADASADGIDALRAALVRGLGIADDSRIGPLTPELMACLGGLLQEATRGALDLLQARSALKREMRADLTMIGGSRNNPLKFTPNAEVALMQLLSPRLRGFMEPGEAMKEVFGDLRAHELGLLAGVRAALERLLKRFDPGQLEARIERGSMLANLVPGTRRARLWDAYAAMYREIAQESADDFQALFGRAFLDAYRREADAPRRATDSEAEQ